MTSLLLNEQSWVTLIYFVVLPLLIVGLAVASLQQKDKLVRRRHANRRDSRPFDPTPMIDDNLPKPIQSFQAGERVVDLTPRASAAAARASEPTADRAAAARLATTEAHLDAAKARIDAQDAELAALLAERDRDRSQLATQQATIARLQDQLSQQAQQLATLHAAAEEVARLRHELQTRHLAPSDLSTPSETMYRIVDEVDDEEDDELLMPMPGSAAEEFDLADIDFDDALNDRILRHDRMPADSQLLTPSVLDGVAMVFDGSTDASVLEAPFAGVSRGDFTLEAWIRPTVTRMPGAVLSYAVAGSCRLLLCAGGPRPSVDVILDGQALPEGREPRLMPHVWQHVAVTWNQRTGALTVYLEGRTSYSGVAAAGASLPDGGTFMLGQQPARGRQGRIPGRAFQGSLAEVRVWSHLRTPEEILRDTHRRVPLQLGLDVWRVG